MVRALATRVGPPLIPIRVSRLTRYAKRYQVYVTRDYMTKLRKTGTGPPAFYEGSDFVYDKRDVDEWINSLPSDEPFYSPDYKK